MTLIEVVGPAAEPVTLAEAKAQCRIDTSDEDVYLEGLIKAARRAVERFLRRRLVTQTVELRRSGLGRSIGLPIAPVQAVVSVTYLDLAGVEQTLAADQYRLARSGLPFVLVPAHGVVWPSVLGGEDTVGIRLTVGYGATGAEVPPDIKAAVLMLIAHFDEHREATGPAMSEIPFGTTQLLMPHVLWV